jgi:hypothetical protein
MESTGAMPMSVDWHKLAAIYELAEGFEPDFEGSQQRIELRLAELESLEPEQRVPAS